jgi:hypothetical protein
MNGIYSNNYDMYRCPSPCVPVYNGCLNIMQGPPGPPGPPGAMGLPGEPAPDLGLTATSDNVPDTLVLRDDTGSFTANNITIEGSLTTPTYREYRGIIEDLSTTPQTILTNVPRTSEFKLYFNYTQVSGDAVTFETGTVTLAWASFLSDQFNYYIRDSGSSANLTVTTGINNFEVEMTTLQPGNPLVFTIINHSSTPELTVRFQNDPNTTSNTFEYLIITQGSNTY